MNVFSNYGEKLFFLSYYFPKILTAAKMCIVYFDQDPNQLVLNHSEL